MKKLKNRIKEYIFQALGRLWPQMQVSLRYRLTHGRWIDWKHPRDIDEKIQWLKFYGDTSQWPRLADKYAVREYVKEKGLEDILVPLIGKWDKAEDIPWMRFPTSL